MFWKFTKKENTGGDGCDTILWQLCRMLIMLIHVMHVLHPTKTIHLVCHLFSFIGFNYQFYIVEYLEFMVILKTHDNNVFPND
jgi:hypothetical protein